MSTAEDIDFPAKLQFLFKPARYKVPWGGRGGAKSWGIARALLILAANSRKRILCAREFQNSISESVHKLLCDQIVALGLEPWYTTTKDSIVGTNGSSFSFAGIRTNPTKIKSMEGIDICWVEEAEKVSKRSWSILIPTIRQEGSEIWVSFNPDEETDPTSQMFLVNAPPNSVVRKIGWQDNPWFPDVLRREMEYLYSVDPEGADHIWGGAFRKQNNAQIFKGKYTIESFIPDMGVFSKWTGPYYGLDFGFSTDPLFGTKSWVFDHRLYIEHEAYGHGIDNDDIAPLLCEMLPGVKDHVVYADSSRPETISHLRKKGHINCVGAKKWDGSVKDGIAFLRSFRQIVIHPRCKHMGDEARLYRFKVDELTGDVLPLIVDANNHGWDAERYAFDPLIKHKKSMSEVL